MAYEIEDGIPCTQYNGKYPFGDMAIGQSFFVPGGKVNVLASSGRGWSKRNNPAARFATRTVDGGVRVWRIK